MKSTSSISRLAGILIFVTLPSGVNAQSLNTDTYGYKYYIRQLKQGPTPWMEVGDSKKHMEPYYIAEPYTEVCKGSYTFIIEVAQSRDPRKLIFEKRTQNETHIILTTKRGQVPEHIVLKDIGETSTEDRYEIPMPIGVWTEFLSEDYWSGSKWEFWWGRGSPK